MKKLKKILLVILIILIILCLGYFGFNRKEKSDVTKQLTTSFDALKSNESNDEKKGLLKQIEAKTSEEENSADVAEEEATTDSEEIMNYFVKMEYSIKKVKIHPNLKEATATVSITNKDMKKVLQNYMQKVFELSLSNAFGSTSSEEDLKQQLADYLNEQINSDDIENVTTDATIELEKKDGKWVIKDESKNEVFNAVLPGFADFADSLGESTGTSTETDNESDENTTESDSSNEVTTESDSNENSEISNNVTNVENNITTDNNISVQ